MISKTEKTVVSISAGNSKMGSIPSISLPAGITCRTGCPCFKKCYARRMEARLPSVKKAYEKNLQVYRDDSGAYFFEVIKKALVNRYFRYHVGGDIPDDKYFDCMVYTALKVPGCTFLCFTKKYEIVNNFLKRGKIPNNLQIVFSAWGDTLKPDNPHALPEAHVILKGSKAPQGVQICGGDCTRCIYTGAGCWSLKSGEKIYIKEH